MKRGGRIIFFGETGYRSQKLVEYFEVCSLRACEPVPLSGDCHMLLHSVSKQSFAEHYSAFFQGA